MELAYLPMPPGTPESPPLDGGTLEESLLRAIEDPNLSAPRELGVALARATGASRVLLYPPGLPDRLGMAAHIEGGAARADGAPKLEQRIERGLEALQAPDWTFLDASGDVWRARLEAPSPSSLVGGILFEGVGSRPRLDDLKRSVDSSRIATLAALAWAIEALKERKTQGESTTSTRPTRADEISSRIPRIETGPVAFPLEGEPQIFSTRSAFSAFPEIVGQSRIMAGILQSVLLAAKSDIPVLIEGESGTGKELVARAIHRASRRNQLPFVCENCGALPESLVESELFGHARGAFTGADQARAGVFERAGGGTVFLDEVGEMDLGHQRKLLRVLQEREVRPLGGQHMLPVDFRLVSATNRVLEEMVAKGGFREDLYYRLQVATIHMPALRERPEDIPVLIEHFAGAFARETGRDPVAFSNAAIEHLAGYAWPGNVRELRNEVWRHACSERSIVDVEHLSRRISRSRRANRGGWAVTPRSLQELERNTIAPMLVEALRRAGGNRSEAARLLGISRTVLYRRLKRYKLVGEEPAKNGGGEAE